MKAILPLLLLPAFAVADNLVSYTGTFTETDHPTLSGAHVVTLKTDGTLSVPADLRLLRVLVVGGGGGGGMGGGAGGQVVDWTPEAPTFLKTDDAWQVVVGPCGYRSNQGSQQARGHNGFPSSVTCSAFEVVALGGGGARGWGYSSDGRWDVESPRTWGNGGGGACDQQAATLIGYEAGAEGCFPGGKATNSGSSGTGCGGGGGGAGSPGTDGKAGSTSDCLGNGGDGLAFDITGESRFYAGGGGAGYSGSSNARGCHGIGGSGIGGDGETSLQSQVYRRPWGHPGRDGTGSGGGGGGQKTGVGGKGGCGVLIVRYLADPDATLILVK